MNEENWLSRTELLVTAERLEKLKQAKVLVVGLGGVGGSAVEQLCRAGIGNITIIDNDKVNLSNINRQIIALNSTVNQAKTEAAYNRLKDINPEINISKIDLFVEKSNLEKILEQNFNYVIDAIDSLTPKVDLLEACVKSNTKVVSSMGSGGRIDPTQITIDDIKNSHHCRFAYFIRKNLHKRGIFEGISAVYSPEQVPREALVETRGLDNKKTIVGTMSYLPVIFGCFCASVVIRDIISE